MDTIKKILFVLISIISLSSCTHEDNSINIAVASNFESTLKTIIHRFKLLHPDSEINLISGSSGVLANQIINNAPFDLFLSADLSKPEYLYKNLTLSRAPSTYAIGKLALWIPTLEPSEKCIQKINEVDSLVIANPDTAPYGAVAAIILKKHKIIPKKLIQASSISQSFLYTKENFAQAGFVAYSMLKDNLQGCQQFFEHRALSQSMLLLDDKAQNIYDYILSDEIQLLIRESGYNTLN